MLSQKISKAKYMMFLTNSNITPDIITIATNSTLKEVSLKTKNLVLLN